MEVKLVNTWRGTTTGHKFAPEDGWTAAKAQGVLAELISTAGGDAANHQVEFQADDEFIAAANFDKPSDHWPKKLGIVGEFHGIPCRRIV